MSMTKRSLVGEPLASERILVVRRGRTPGLQALLNIYPEGLALPARCGTSPAWTVE